MTDPDRIALMRQMRKHGATLQMIADRFSVSPQYVARALQARTPSERRHGRPCPKCKGSSRVVKTRISQMSTRRRHECIECLYRWNSRELDEI